ncbi:hypothetical protein H5410_017842 [Solanum commersonii]|uniref:Uncharacterized protein n=1 Tax=Solanum commersonii TaxID=4109 RepID=A0A9J6A156_SOLCO|nr:hypothetical protein H5410_017842 [Solanum commersonii]
MVSECLLCWVIWHTLKDFGILDVGALGQEVIRAISRMSDRPGWMQKCPMNGGGVQWCRLYKTRVISKTVTTYQIVEPYYEDLGESGGDESEKRGVHLRILDSCRTFD